MKRRRHTVEGVADRERVQFACELRKEPTRGERLLWQELRRGELGVRFRRQHPIGCFILDSCWIAQKLAVEIDSPSPRQTGSRARLGGGFATPEPRLPPELCCRTELDLGGRTADNQGARIGLEAGEAGEAEEAGEAGGASVDDPEECGHRVLRSR